MSQHCPTAVPAGLFSPFCWDSPRPFPLVAVLRLGLGQGWDIRLQQVPLTRLAEV